jgi:hypothetical protein
VLSDRAGPPFVFPPLGDSNFAEYSRDSCIRLRLCSASNLFARSSLIDFFAK